MSSVSETAVAASVRTDACAREQIHIPEAIQDRGALLGLDARGRLVHASANADAVLGVKARAWGCRIEELLPPEAGAGLLGHLAELPDTDGAPLVLGTVTVAAGEHALLAHRGGDGGFVVELERQRPEDVTRTVGGVTRMLREVHPTVVASAGIDALCGIVAAEVQRLTRFDRVMVYRFDEDASGVVLADRHLPEMADYLDLRFPAADIPPQARELYRRSTVRFVGDVNAPTIPLERAGDTPLDLTFAGLRALSPVHLQYLRNMGAGASMSVSILDEGRLWGLIACQHRTAHRVPPEIRALCEFLALAFGLRLPGQRAADRAEGRRRRAEARARILQDAPAAGGPEALNPERLMDVVESDGAAICSTAGISCHGHTPPPAAIAEIAAGVRELSHHGVWSTRALATDLPEVGPAVTAGGGLLAVALPGGSGDLALWFRREVAETVAWAGDPRKPVAVDAGGRLSPRGSFAVWAETVRGRSAAWSQDDLDAAAELRTALAAALARHAAALLKLNTALTRSNEELDAFAYTASHDLTEPLRGIHNYARFTLEDHGDALGDTGRDKLDAIVRLTVRMELVIDSLLQISRLGRAEVLVGDVDVDALLAEVVELQAGAIGDHHVEVRVDAPLGTIRSDATKLREILLNLVANAVKYAADRDVRWVQIRTRRDGDDAILEVRDNGIGIAPEHVEDVFKLFRRLHERDAYGGGVGAGLAIVQRLATRLGGTIDVLSVPGSGTAFTVRLPQGGSDD